MAPWRTATVVRHRPAVSCLFSAAQPYLPGRHRSRLPDQATYDNHLVHLEDAYAPGARYWSRRPFRHAAGGEWMTVLAVALGLASMVLLPMLVISLVPSGLSGAGAATGPRTLPVSAVPRFAPATIEAEAPTNRISGSAKIDRYPDASGGSLVHGLGNYQKAVGPGVLRFYLAAPLDGTYTMAFFYAHLNNDTVRTAVITVDNDSPVSVTVAGSLFCCRSRSLQIHLRVGVNTITFTNPTDHAPSIDRIVISASAPPG